MSRDHMLQAVDAAADELIEISRDIHARPELAFEERYASHRLSQAMADHGMKVTRAAYGLDTAFEAEFGCGDGPCVALLAE